MKKSTLVAGAAGAVAGGVAFKQYLQYYRPGPAPSSQEAHAYLDGLFERMGLAGLRDHIEEDSIACGGERLHLDVFESPGSKRAMVFVPGTSLYALAYAEYMHKMRLMGFNVVGFDPRGHGRSGGRRGSYTLDTLLEDAAAVVGYAMDRFGDGVAISGSSQGGIVAFYSAARDDRLRAAVCHNIAVMDEPAVYSISRWPAVARMAGRFMPLAGLTPELRLPISVYLDLAAEPTRFGMNALEFVKQDPLVVLAVALKALASLVSAPLGRPVEDISVPVMVLQAELDALFTEGYTRSIYDRLTCEKELLVVGGATHLILTNDVDAVVPEVAAFLTEHM